MRTNWKLDKTGGHLSLPRTVVVFTPSRSLLHGVVFVLLLHLRLRPPLLAQHFLLYMYMYIYLYSSMQSGLIIGCGPCKRVDRSMDRPISVIIIIIMVIVVVSVEYRFPEVSPLSYMRVQSNKIPQERNSISARHSFLGAISVYYAGDWGAGSSAELCTYLLTPRIYL